MSWAEVSTWDTAEGLAKVVGPSLQPTSCAGMADSSVEGFGHWGPISLEEALSAHPGTLPSLQ